MTKEQESLVQSLRVQGHRHAFDTTEDTEYVVATIEVRIAVDPRRELTAHNRSRGLEVMAGRAVHGAADAYAWYSAQVDSVTLVSVTQETVDD